MIRARLGAVRADLARRAKRATSSGAPDNVVVHCAHHKVGTVWFGNVLQGVAAQHGLRYQEVGSADVDPRADVYLFTHTRHFHRAALAGRAFRGTHLIRDPRDIAVSGYHYHLWTTERWANVPEPRFDGRSYREQLNSVDRDAGLLLEIERTCTQGQLPEMVAWDYDQPEFLELRYEELVADEQKVFESALRHLGFDDKGVRDALEVVDSFSFQKVTGRALGETGGDSHLRSGRPGDWRDQFGPEHVRRWKELAGQSLITLGYEKDLSW